MPASIRIVRHGKASRLAVRVNLDAYKRDDPLAPVTVVVRSPLAGLDLRRRLASESGLVNVRFAVLSRLAELLAADELIAAGTGPDHPRPMSQAVLGAALRAALAEEPGVLAPVVGHPSTAAALAATYRDLRQATPEELERLRGCGDRAADVVRIAVRARDLLWPRWYDSDDLADAAASALRAGRGSFQDVGPVIVHLPDLLRPSEVRLLVALAGRAQLVVMLGVTGDERADAASSDQAVTLGRLLGCEAVVDSVDVADASGGALSEVVSAPDPEAEVREAIRRVLAHDGSGGSMGRCAIAHPGSRRYGRLLAEQLAAGGLPWNGPACETLAETPEARVLSGLVAMAASPLELERSAVFSWLRRGPILDRSGVGVPLGGWDRVSREAGVVSGLEEWRNRLAALAARCVEHRPDSAALAVGLQDFVDRLADVCGELLRCGSWEAFVRWAAAAVEEYLARSDDEVHRQVELALDELLDLDRLEPLGGLSPPARHDRMTRALATVLDRPAPRVGRFGRGVVVAPIASLVGVETELLVVVGALEGELPGRTSDDPLLPAGERHRAGSLVRERAEVRDRRHLLALLRAADRSLATWPRVDTRKGRSAIASRWLDGDLASGAAETAIGSFAGMLRRVALRAAPACDALDYELASLQEWCEAGRAGDRHFLTAFAPGFAAALDVGRARLAWSLNRFNGLAAQSTRPADAAEGRPERLLSATTVEMYATCPFRGFLKHDLRLHDFDAPERRITIEPMDRGSLIHGVLERLVDETLASGRPWSGWTAEDHLRLAELAREAFGDYERRGLVGRALLWELEKSHILLELDRFLDSDDRRCRAGARVPIAAEYRFGDEDVPPLEIVAAGRPVRFRGMVDRIDRGRDGSLTVVDYKTGSSGSYTVLESDPVGGGERLQLAIYGLAAEAGLGGGSPPGGERPEGAGRGGGDVRAEYRFLSSSASRESIGIVLGDEARARLGEALDTLVGLIDEGAFPARPGVVDRDSYKNCQWCEFDTLCSADRDRAWQRVRTDQRLRGYVALVEPDERDDALELNVAADVV